MTGCAIGRDETEARERIRRRLDRAGQNVDPDEYKATRGEATILGTLDEAAARLRAYEDAGVERVMLQHLDHTRPRHGRADRPRARARRRLVAVRASCGRSR